MAGVRIRGSVLLAVAATAFALYAIHTGPRRPRSSVISSEFLFDTAPFVQCHASTIAQTENGLVAAWFGGTSEGAMDVAIWLAHREDAGWSAPTVVADGVQPNGDRLPCWNPVFFQVGGGPLLLFYKVGLSPRSWWGMMMSSHDAGRSWSQPRRLPPGVLGPTKNKPVQLADGSLLCPSSTEEAAWRVRLERTHDLGQTWSSSDLLGQAEQVDVIQPTILPHSADLVQLLCRSRYGRLMESWSGDGGNTWSTLQPSSLPNPNSGVDAVQLRDGRSLVVYNQSYLLRSPLNVAISSDGKSWAVADTLEDGWGEYSYPAVIQSSDGLVHVTYTWKRQRIKHVVLDPARIADQQSSVRPDQGDPAV